ncbi:6-phosphogluconate dehydrogenase C-terminal domain-like protein [Myriangium duriaei CBS 260.36]|uniref:6-phosphogluconate dehydrogenase C-terminal domain-like protein n=1 Tax=Myriangium duriaei CBS 260.36 TaxID=1168546 RepID=A0A9P4J6A9_9PEZI|nr:6-phosphogluconate dehydrogenase C-terminal domain-like protein [Myriangium duriaei CBS 260.36]
MRAIAASIDLVDSDADLAQQADYILSIVPPHDAEATAQRIISALTNAPARTEPLYYLDLNAISPRLARSINTLFQPLGDHVRFVDGGIIGGPPTCQDPQHPENGWSRPSIPMSGRWDVSESPVAGPELAQTLHARHIGPNVGAASGLKMCFAALHKGFTALAVESFTTAHRLGVLGELKTELAETGSKAGQMAQGLVKMPPKAYRWVREMEEIDETFAEDGGFENERIFAAVARLYDTIATGTELGGEITEKRKRGQTVDDVAECMSEGLEQRKARKTA